LKMVMVTSESGRHKNVYDKYSDLFLQLQIQIWY
jgi:hypothetical protein